VIENWDSSEERALSDKCGSYLTEHVVILNSCSWGTKKNWNNAFYKETKQYLSICKFT